jgi:hypothetical protein
VAASVANGAQPLFDYGGTDGGILRQQISDGGFERIEFTGSGA